MSIVLAEARLRPPIEYHSTNEACDRGERSSSRKRRGEDNLLVLVDIQRLPADSMPGSGDSIADGGSADQTVCTVFGWFPPNSAAKIAKLRQRCNQTTFTDTICDL